MGEYLVVSTKELKRKVILEEVKKGLINLKAASLRLGVSYRQAKRLKKRYQEKGDKVHIPATLAHRFLRHSHSKHK